jgi:hypothetical protein
VTDDQTDSLFKTTLAKDVPRGGGKAFTLLVIRKWRRSRRRSDAEVEMCVKFKLQ